MTEFETFAEMWREELIEAIDTSSSYDAFIRDLEDMVRIYLDDNGQRMSEKDWENMGQDVSP